MSECNQTKAKVGSVSWTELASSEPGKSLEFYTQLMGWKAEEMPGGGYHMLKTGDGEVAGLLDKSAHCDGPPMWISYLTVESLEASLAKVVDLGGKEMMGITPVEGRGRFAMVEDPQGAKFALWEYLA